MTESLIADVADTAFWVAHYRGEETKRPDALFADPLAERLAGERGARIARGMSRSKYTRWSVVMRTTIIDAYIREHVAAGFDTVVNLGAGLDTRPYRLELPPNLRWIEVDQPKIIEFKTAQLRDATPGCALQRIGLDLADRNARNGLLAELAAQSERALVLTEGVIPYLTPEQVAELAHDLHAQRSFQGWILEYYAPEVFRHLKKARSLNAQMQHAPFQFFPLDWHGLFAAHGWCAREMRYLGEESLKHGRPIPLPWWASILRLLMPPKKRAETNRFMAYALLERKTRNE
jgi:methyltransferase (TIGR00027 family)